ncbi:DUF2288 domain-containing protein [Geitlerinema sp. PCC 7407]|uniref:DUF2288 domain-containing protein n=1 Tax=Geitlerinema sp. PCC 7407 TaxID=1173025 RepID=UPI00029FD79F|nr:DUF2288 domain-containing protein [Geitlerinema sp. PCC 7407]AFY66886.1 Protein of unknown function DUF2288 [Geitlerinema sp. PCC 7407]
MEDLKTQLADNLAEAEWDWLKPHAQRDAIILVSSELDILEVGVAIANDNVQAVQRWITEQLIAKPSAEQLSFWNQDDTRKFTSLIVAPYVLIKEIAPEA